MTTILKVIAVFIGLILLIFLNAFLMINAFKNTFVGILFILVIIVEFVLLARFIYVKSYNSSEKMIPGKKYRSKLKKIKLTPKFKEIYYNLEKEYGQELETIRKKLIFIFVILIILSIIFGLVFIIFSDTSPYHRRNHIDAKSMIAFIPLSLVYIIYTRNKKKYKEKFKNDIISNFVYYINPNLKYNQDRRRKYDYTL